ncbi:sensor histidine kinase [Paenibacillus rigui]|uniref:Sensor histidine kinase n=1 Tax=Paenibacillus rigui TaxID=554312 RepID=A0A229UHY0_9BACL|nr:sensor histidine kinase [Paenibacillus rigui]OXM82961.1 hypothetical protein CF651_28560 [Paenibacillus rigui]
MPKTLSALLSNFTAKLRGSTATGNKLPSFVDSRLKRKFFVSHLIRILIPCFIPLLILGTLSIFITNWYIRNNVEQSNANQLNQLNELAQVISSEVDSLSLSFDKDPKITLRLKSILSGTTLSYENLEALYYLKNVIDVPANSKPYIQSVYIYYENPEGRFLSSREGLTQISLSDDTSWFERYADLRSRKEEMITEVRQTSAYGFGNQSTRLLTIYKPFSYGYPGYNKGLIVMNVRPSYFETSFHYFDELPQRYFYIANAEGEPLVTSANAGAQVPLPAERRQLQGEDGLVRFEHGDSLVIAKSLPRLRWDLVSVVPTNELYSLPHTLIYMTIALCLVSLLFSSVYALWTTRRNYRQIEQIVRILESAEQFNQPMPTIPSKINDLYEWIVKTILEAFLEHKYVKIQLSERKAKMELLELRALQSQMNPHFLYNTLHSIYWKSFQLTQSPNDACRMIEQLSGLMEYAVRTTDDLVPLRDEMANVRSYVHIQRTRFPDKIDVVWDSDEQLEACRVMKISLQPLIENSIRYGLEHRSDLRIRIKCRLQGPHLRVTVTDNGPGISKARLAQLRTTFRSDTFPSDHVGLYNTYKRLALQYGPGDGDDPLLRIYSHEGRGTCIDLLFPQHQE